MQKAQFLKLSEVELVLDNLEAFALVRYDASEHKASPLKWVDDEDIVYEFGDAIYRSTSDKDFIPAILRQRVFLKDVTARKFWLYFYSVGDSQTGFAICADGFLAVKSAAMMVAIKSGYGIDKYSSTKDCLAYHNVPDPYDHLVVDTSTTREIGELNYTKIAFVGAHDQIAQFFEQKYGDDIVVITIENDADPLATIVSYLNIARRSGMTLQQIFLNFHGSAGHFGINALAGQLPPNGIVGDTPGNISITDFAQAIGPLVPPNITLTILSCDVAANMTEDDGTVINGIDEIRQIPFEWTGGHVVITNSTVFVNQDGDIGHAPEVNGTVYDVFFDSDVPDVEVRTIQPRTDSRQPFPLDRQ